MQFDDPIELWDEAEGLNDEEELPPLATVAFSVIKFIVFLYKRMFREQQTL